MKKLFATTTILLALCACSHKDVTETPATPAPVAAAAPTEAQAILQAAKKQKVKGTVHFTQDGDKVKIEGMLEGLKPGKHGVHIHEKGDCSMDDFSSAGGHFNPGHTDHGAPDVADKHAGDMGNITADKKGNAKVSLEVASMMIGGDTGIIGKALIIHEKKDDLHTQPSGDSGGRVACGVIDSVK
jgi:Cu-Zn family superoxide dismutase